LEKAIDLGGDAFDQDIEKEIDLVRLVTCGATFLACSVAMVTGSAAASARPSHHQQQHVHVAHHVAHRVGHHGARRQHPRAAVRTGIRQEAIPSANANFGGPGSMPTYAPVDDAAAYASVPRARRAARQRVPIAKATTGAFGGFGGSTLVAEARRYLGTNPTGRRSLWCGAFIDKVLRETGHQGGGNLAKGYLHYGHRVSGPQIGAIAVMGRKGGGHVGVVSGIDPNGNPIIVSGNHNHAVSESAYPRGRIIAYVKPNT
jgi:uncharacterized protein (TIGR02594 family)